MHIRPARPDDADAVVALHRVAAPYLVTTSRQVRFQLSSSPTREAFAGYVAASQGDLVGWASAGLVPGAVPPAHGQVKVLVHPDHRARGIGGALAEAVHDHLRAAGARRSQVFADLDAVGFARRRGYFETRLVHYAGAAPQALPEPPPVPAGLRLVPVAELDPRLVYAADLIAQRTKPGDAKIGTRAYADWLGGVWRIPDMLLGISVAAVDGGRVVAFTLTHGDDQRIWSRMTGTVPECRGQGLAKMVKWATLRRAAEAGVRGAFTANYDGNEPMLAVNEWLGYRRTTTHSVLVRDL